ncbi:MAG: prolyl oligopeptidase family serine peptidase, partial [Chloroflexota bacterium]
WVKHFTRQSMIYCTSFSEQNYTTRVFLLLNMLRSESPKEANEGNNVILLRIDTKAGHGMGKPTAKVIDQKVDVYAFLNTLFEMGV